MNYKLSELVTNFGGELLGDDVVISGIAPTNLAKEGQITFITDNKYKSILSTLNATAIIIGKNLLLEDEFQEIKISKIVTDDPYLYFSLVSQLFNPTKKMPAGIKSTVVMDVNVAIGENVAIADFVSLGHDVLIGNNCQIYTHVTIGDNVIIGKNVTIYPNVVIYSNVTIGDNCTFHGGAVVGADGFGYAPDKKKNWHKIPQIGGVVIGNNVDVGANTTIDSGTFVPTIIEDGVIIDNQVQIAHNVTIGAHTAIAACVGIAGGTKIGKYCQLAGGAGISGHIEIADYTVIGGLTGVTKTITKPDCYVGLFPAMPLKEWAKTAVHLKKLTEMYDTIKNLKA